ncbi:MAG: CRISPR-associated endonuclease Cas2 [Spirochaetes bacterium]|nr:MAG: CRISPR-associated endonuclease Cas2 [Spirochaetota bacterium]
MKHWLVIYDIRNEKRLHRVAKTMERYGTRVQKSVFEIEAGNKTIKRLRNQVNDIIESEDFVVYFDICERDWQKRMKYGPKKFKGKPCDKEYLII